MFRCKTLGLSLLALCLVISQVSAQKVMCDQTSAIGFNIYAHNWNTTENNLDSSGPSGGTVNFLTNQAMFGGPPSLMDNVHTCWTHEATRGGGDGNVTSGRALGNGWAISSFSVCIGNTAGGGVPSGPIVGPTTIAGWAETVANQDLCIAPYNANPVLMTGGLFVPLTHMNLGSGVFCIVRFFTSPQVLTTSVVDSNGVWHGGTVVYEVQHGYNGTTTNQMDLGAVSINELTYPVAGGIAEGDLNYGTADGWGPGQIASSSRFISFSTGYIFTLPGQTAEGNCDGLDFVNSIAVEDGVTLPGKKNAFCVDGQGNSYYDYGDGGNQWTAGNCDRINVKALNYYYGQLNNQAGNCPDPANTYRAEILWSKTAHGVLNPPEPIGGQFFSVVPDSHTMQLIQFPQLIGWTKKFAPAGLLGDLGTFLYNDGAWPAFGDGVHTEKIGSGSFPKGDNPGSPNGDRLDLCNPKAGPAGFKSGRTWYVGHVVLRKNLSAGVEMVVDSGMDNIIHFN